MSQDELQAVSNWIAGGAAVLSLVAIGVSVRANKWSKLSAISGARQADAAEESNRLTRETVVQAAALHVDAPLTDPVGITDSLELELVPGGPAGTGADVTWTIERPGKNGFVLRNQGTDTAHGVSIDAEQLRRTPHRNLPDDATIGPGSSREFLMLPVWGAPIPNDVTVFWDGDGGARRTATLPVPSW